MSCSPRASRSWRARCTHVLAEGAPPAPAEMWVSVRTPDGRASGAAGAAASCGWPRRSAEEPVPLGVGWLFQDVTESKQIEQEAAQLRFRDQPAAPGRAGRRRVRGPRPRPRPSTWTSRSPASPTTRCIDRVADGGPAADGTATAATARYGWSGPPRRPPGRPGPSASPGRPDCRCATRDGHPALQCVERAGSVRASAGPSPSRAGAREWAAAARSGRRTSVHAPVRGAAQPRPHAWAS